MTCYVSLSSKKFFGYEPAMLRLPYKKKKSARGLLMNSTVLQISAYQQIPSPSWKSTFKDLATSTSAI